MRRLGHPGFAIDGGATIRGMLFEEIEACFPDALVVEKRLRVCSATALQR